MTQREAAGHAKMHHVTACRVAQRPEFRSELKRLREESEHVLAERLPDLIRQSLDVLSGEIAFPSERRLRAIKIALDLAARLCAEPVVISSQLAEAGVTVTLESADGHDLEASGPSSVTTTYASDPGGITTNMT
jgi:hypothetical protein